MYNELVYDVGLHERVFRAVSGIGEHFRIGRCEADTIAFWTRFIDLVTIDSQSSRFDPFVLTVYVLGREVRDGCLFIFERSVNKTDEYLFDFFVRVAV